MTAVKSQWQSGRLRRSVGILYSWNIIVASISFFVSVAISEVPVALGRAAVQRLAVALLAAAEAFDPLKVALGRAGCVAVRLCAVQAGCRPRRPARAARTRQRLLTFRRQFVHKGAVWTGATVEPGGGAVADNGPEDGNLNRAQNASISNIVKMGCQGTREHATRRREPGKSP